MKKIMSNALLVIGFAILSATTANAQRSGKSLEDTKPPVSVTVTGIVHLASTLCPLMIELEGEKYLIPLNLDQAYQTQDKKIKFTYKIETTVIDTKCDHEAVVSVSSVTLVTDVIVAPTTRTRK